MELFGYIGWITVPEYIVNLVLRYGNISAETLAESIAIERLCYFIILGVGLGLFFIGVIFGGLGLLKLAKRAGIKHAWIGFLPFGNTYLTGELAGETRIFGSRVKRIGLWTMVCEIVFVLLNIFGFTMEICLMHPEYYVVQTNSAGQVTGYAIETTYLPASVRWMATATTVVYIVQVIFALVVLYMFCTLFFAFYRKYYARSPFLMTFLSSVLPGRGFAIFAVRNNAPVDYNAYMRRRMQQQQQQYGGYGYPPQGGYNNPQNGGYPPQGGYNNPQNGGYPPQSPNAPDEPFGGEFGGAPTGGAPSGSPANNAPPTDDDPFSDF